MWNPPSEKSLRKIPRLYETEGVEARNKLIYLHFYIGSSDWFVAEYDGEDLFFGFACLNGWRELAEWGYISFQELKDLKVRQRIGEHFVELEVECDEYWEVSKAEDVELIKECQGW